MHLFSYIFYSFSVYCLQKNFIEKHTFWKKKASAKTIVFENLVPKIGITAVKFHGFYILTMQLKLENQAKTKGNETQLVHEIASFGEDSHNGM